MAKKLTGRSENFSGERARDTGKHKPSQPGIAPRTLVKHAVVAQDHSYHSHDPREYLQIEEARPANAGPLQEAEMGEKTSEQVFHSSDPRVHTDASAFGGVTVDGKSAHQDPWPGPHPRGT